MLIVVGVIGILMAATVPYFLRPSPASEASRAAEAVAHTMRLARFRAIAMNREVYVHFEPASTQSFMTAYANLGNPGDVPSGTPAEVAAVGLPAAEMRGSWLGTPLEDGVAFDAGAASSGPTGGSIPGPIDMPLNPLVFDGRGRIVGAPAGQRWVGTVYLAHQKNPSAVRAVTISPSGLVKVWYLNGSSWK